MPALSVVVPVFNERGNIPPLLAEIATALRGRVEFEVVYVDDASRDDSLAVLSAAKAEHPELRVIRHLQQSGQSTAIRSGVKAARGSWIATLDGDGQNDPADIPKLLAMRDESPPAIKLFAGWRVNRQDSGSKRWASKWANAIRSRLLRDDTPDTGCGIKLFERAAFLDLPYFDHMASKRDKIRLISSAGTGHFYTTDKNKKNTPEKMLVKKYDPVVRKHVEYKEGKIK